MLRVLAFGAAAGAAVQAWRQFPPDAGPLSARPLALVFIAGVVAAYLGGRWASRGGATATAVASASATANAAATGGQATVNLYVAAPASAAVPADSSAPAFRPGVQFPTDSAPWLGAPRAALELSELDGLDVAELVESSDYSEQHDG